MSIAHIEAIIFDMDGVIIDSEKLWKQAENEIFTSLGVEVIEENSAKTESMTTAEVTSFWYSKFPWKHKKLKDVEEMVISRVIELIVTEQCLICGVKSFIERLRSQKYKIGLATNSPYRVIPTVLQKLEVSHLFDAVSSAEFEQKGKPDPAIYQTTAKVLNIDPRNCLVIEDSYSGILAAKNAGMTVVAFTNGNKGVNHEMADYSIDGFEFDKFVELS